MTPTRPAKGATLDTGFLIAVERRHARALALLRTFLRGQVVLTVPAVVLAEWWRGSPEQRHVRSRLGPALVVEPVDEYLAERAGVAVARVRGATTNDALVMASAAHSGNTVYTSDFEDLAASPSLSNVSTVLSTPSPKKKRMADGARRADGPAID